jgi:hypothetical protein
VPLNTTRSKPDRVPMTEPACLAENGFTASPASGSARSCKTQTIRIEDGAPYQRFGCGQRPRHGASDSEKRQKPCRDIEGRHYPEAAIA